MALDYFTITTPADMHCHFRQGEMLDLVVPATAERFGYAIAMPNTSPPITTIAQVWEYLRAIKHAAGPFSSFEPLGVAYVNESLDAGELRRGFEEEAWVAAKLYPRGGTTGSEHSAETLRAVYPLFEVMQEIGMPLLVHGEVVGPDFRPFSRWEREGIHVREVMPVLRSDFPRLKIVREHISTKEAVREVLDDESGYLAATITPHHALLTDGDLSKGGLQTSPNCMPIIKGPEDRDAIQEPMVSGDERFFAGTDSAPHDVTTKYAACCSFGAYVAPGAVQVYAAIFERHEIFDLPDGIQRFEKFMSLNGPRFYGLPPALGKVTLVRNTQGYKVRDRFIIPSKKILQPNVEVVALFHEDLGLAPDFPWTFGGVNFRN